MDYFILVIGWGLYFFIHSALASQAIKNRIVLGQQTYRIIYVILSTVGLFGLFLYGGSISGERLLPKNGITRYMSLFITVAGVLIARQAFKETSVSKFLGLKKENNGQLQTGGIYAWVRHPLYSATLLITIGLFLFDSRMATLVSVLCIWVYLIPGIWLEEKKLVKQFGKAYKDYQQNVAAIIPFIL